MNNCSTRRWIFKDEAFKSVRRSGLNYWLLFSSLLLLGSKVPNPDVTIEWFFDDFKAPSRQNLPPYNQESKNKTISVSYVAVNAAFILYQQGKRDHHSKYVSLYFDRCWLLFVVSVFKNYLFLCPGGKTRGLCIRTEKLNMKLCNTINLAELNPKTF